MSSQSTFLPSQKISTRPISLNPLHFSLFQIILIYCEFKFKRNFFCSWWSWWRNFVIKSKWKIVKFSVSSVESHQCCNHYYSNVRRKLCLQQLTPSNFCIQTLAERFSIKIEKDKVWENLIFIKSKRFFQGFSERVWVHCDSRSSRSLPARLNAIVGWFMTMFALQLRSPSPLPARRRQVFIA